MNTLFSVCYWAFGVVTSFLLFLGALLLWSLTAPFDPARSLLHRYTCWWAQLYLRCLPGCEVRVEGREKIAPHTPYVLVANHQSAVDILALSFLDVQFKWTSRKENFRIPFIGWNMSLNGYVRVEPASAEKVRAMVARCRSWLEQGVPVLWFPEGTRSFDGKLLGFRGGAFRLAAECGCAMVPIAVDGTVGVYRGWRVRAFPGRMLVRVLDPLTLAEAGGHGRRAARARLEPHVRGGDGRAGASGDGGDCLIGLPGTRRKLVRASGGEREARSFHHADPGVVAMIGGER